MSNKALVKVTVADSGIVANFDEIKSRYAENAGKTINALVKATLESYKSTAVKLHATACYTLFHAMETGDSRPLTSFFNGIRQNDRDALRVWVGKMTAITLAQEDGSEVIKPMLTFKKDSGFGVVKGTENLRKGYIDIDKLLASPSFQDINQDKEKPEMTLAKLLAYLAGVKKKADKEVEENGFALPNNIKLALESLNAEVLKLNPAK